LAAGETIDRMTVGIEEAGSAAAAGQIAGQELRDEALSVLESRGWSASPEGCAPKVAALASLLKLAPPVPVARVSYQSRGNLLIIAGTAGGLAGQVAERLASSLHVTLIQEGPRAQGASYAVWSGRVESIAGYLGEFSATIAGLDSGDGTRRDAAVPARFDLVLDFSANPLFGMRQPPQGYFAAPGDEEGLRAVEAELRASIGEFEKPRFFAYRENLCAHSRSEITGCNACIEICSTQAISSDGNHVKVDPHLCMGCGACSTVCPSGAMGYQYPTVSDRGAQVKALLSAYREAGGQDPVIVFHNGADGRDLLAGAARAGHGLPARVLPLEMWHVAALGLDLMLPAITFGACQVAVLCTRAEDADYVAALESQMAIGQAVLSQLGYAGVHFRILRASTPEELAQSFDSAVPSPMPVPAAFQVGNDKRTAIEFALEHLVKHASVRVEQVALPAGSPYGEVKVDKAKCTMCLACVGACPASALMDGVDVPLLKFLERNCVQCGLCEQTCPEEAISLAPRLLLTPQVREARVLNETQPFHCVSCNKPFGTRQMVDAMVGRLATHSMFSGGNALRRLQMCGDCRIVDMMKSKDEASILTLRGDA
jgi:ferredoxin